MIDYIKKYISDEIIYNSIKDKLSNEVIKKMELLSGVVTENLDYLKEYGVNNLDKLIINRPDICFYKLNVLKEKLSKYEKNFIINMFENTPDILINFNI